MQLFLHIGSNLLTCALRTNWMALFFADSWDRCSTDKTDRTDQTWTPRSPTPGPAHPQTSSGKRWNWPTVCRRHQDLGINKLFRLCLQFSQGSTYHYELVASKMWWTDWRHCCWRSSGSFVQCRLMSFGSMMRLSLFRATKIHSCHLIPLTMLLNNFLLISANQRQWQGARIQCRKKNMFIV